MVDTVKSIVAVDTLKKYNALDALGSFMSGLPQRDSNAFTSLETDPSWQAFRVSMDSNWNLMYDSRLSKMKAWQSESFSAQPNDSLRIFYPFSGPDFLHLHYLVNQY